MYVIPWPSAMTRLPLYTSGAPSCNAHVMGQVVSFRAYDP